jgi:hypothetical protein
LPHIKVLRQHLLLGVLGAGGGFVQSLAVVGGLYGGADGAVHLLEEFGVVELRQVVGQLPLVELEQECAPVVVGRAAGLSVGIIAGSEKTIDDNFYTLRIKLLTDFSRLSTVRVISSEMSSEIKEVETNNTEKK